MTEKRKLTQKSAATLKAPESGRRWIYDEQAPGLALMITSNDSRSWYFYRKVRGTPTKVHLGKFPAIAVEQARKLCFKALADIADGKDPSAKRRIDADSVTLGELRLRYVAAAGDRLRPKTQVNDKSTWKCWETWQGKKLSTITPEAVTRHHAAWGKKRGPVAANRALELLRRTFNWAGKNGYAGSNPTQGVDMFTEHSRERYLLPDELRRIWAAIDDETQLFRDYFACSILTGARRANVQGMRWADISLPDKTWTIPGTAYKSGKAKMIHLVPKVMEILERRKADAAGDWVFPSVRRSKAGHITEPRYAWKRICERAKVENCTIHDIRRTHGSWMASTGASLPLISHSLGHDDASSTAIYARLNIESVRAAVDAAAAAMLATATTEDTKEGADDAKEESR